MEASLLFSNANSIDSSFTDKILAWSIKLKNKQADLWTEYPIFFCNLFMFILLWLFYVSAEQIKLTVDDLVVAGDLLGVVVMISIIMNIYTIFVVSKNWKTFVQVKISNLKFGYHNMLFALTLKQFNPHSLSLNKSAPSSLWEYKFWISLKF